LSALDLAEFSGYQRKFFWIENPRNNFYGRSGGWVYGARENFFISKILRPHTNFLPLEVSDCS
jgi:hypothetical protein